MTLSLYNTLTRREEVFSPADSRNVRLYVCGPTVYDKPHIGNARSVVVYDVLFRLLRHLHGERHVTYVRNITDVDDKINAAAKAVADDRPMVERIKALTGEITAGFHADMEALGCLRPTHEPRATEHIGEMIAMIRTLIERGHAYAAEGHALFSVASDPNYGCLSRRSRDEMVAGARVEVAPYKKDPGDFVLWKPSAADEPGWDSPWGFGRPGWHIECSAMSTKLLGADFDLHGGGADLMFPHHENEIAQSTCAHAGSGFARFWVHNGFLTVNGEKMSKSLGNFITVRELLEQGVKGEAIRYALLATHYRKPLDFSEKALEDAKKALDGFYRALEGLPAEAAATPRDEEVALLCADLNVSALLARMQELATQIHKASEKHALQAQLKAAGRLIGLLQDAPERFLGKGAAAEGEHAGIQALVDARIAAKKAKNWAEADRIRQALKEQGILLEDRPDGSTDWRRA